MTPGTPDEIYCVCSTLAGLRDWIPHWSNFSQPRDQSLVMVDAGDKLHTRHDWSEPKTFDTYLYYNEQVMRDKLRFLANPSKRHYWNSYGNRNAIWFYANLRMLLLYTLRPDAKWYWFFDDDVTCSNWSSFFSGFQNEDADFLSYFIFKDVGVQSQPKVPNVGPGMHSFSSESCNWFNRFPGDGDVLPPSAREKFGSFFAVNRYSNRAMRLLANANARGFLGYSEGFVPTVLNNAGYSMASIFRPDNTSPYFDVNRVKVLHKHTDITWQWL